MASWEHWRSLLSVSKHGSFSGAAEALGVNATTISRRIHALERNLGGDLFRREDGRLFPTIRCEALLSALQTADDALHRAEQQGAAQSPHIMQTLRMTAPPFLIASLFAPTMHRLTATRALQVDMTTAESNAALTRHEVDLSVRIEDQPWDCKPISNRIDGIRLPPLRLRNLYLTKSK